MKKTLKQEMLEAIYEDAYKMRHNGCREIRGGEAATVCASIAEKHINNERAKLKALLEGLETQHIEKLIELGKVGDFRNYGIAYFSAVKDKIKIARLEGMISLAWGYHKKQLEQELEELKAGKDL